MRLNFAGERLLGVVAHPDDAEMLCAGTLARAKATTAARPPALWWMDTINMAGFEPGFFVDVSEWVELKRRMLACHRSQLARGGRSDFAPLEPLMLAQCRARGAQAGVEAAEAFRIHPAWKRAGAW